MANCKTNLSPTHIRYLLAMLCEQRACGIVRCTSLAATLGIKKPSVHAMLGVLAQRGLAEKNERGEIRLTPRGMQLGMQYQKGFWRVQAVLRREFPGFCDTGEVCCLLLSKLSHAQLCALQDAQGE